jgi:Integrase core domain
VRVVGSARAHTPEAELPRTLRESLKLLLHDRDTKFSRAFDEVFHSEGIDVIETPVQAPNANANAERWVRTVRRECLDRILILGRGHLERILRVYTSHYNRHRPIGRSGSRLQTAAAPRIQRPLTRSAGRPPSRDRGLGGPALLRERPHTTPPAEPTQVSVGLAAFGGDFSGIRRFAERDHENIVHWSVFDDGGHFAAHKVPQLLVEDIRWFFRALR